MSWDDKPTYAQLETIGRWIDWPVGRELTSKALKWLENNASRRAVSLEMSRLKELKEKRLLDASTCFRSEIWRGFEHE